MTQQVVEQLDDYLGVAGLREKVVGVHIIGHLTKIGPGHLIARLGEYDHRKVSTLSFPPHTCTHLETIHIGEIEIHNQNVRRVQVTQQQDIPPVLRNLNGISRSFQFLAKSRSC